MARKKGILLAEGFDIALANSKADAPYPMSPPSQAPEAPRLLDVRDPEVLSDGLLLLGLARTPPGEQLPSQHPGEATDYSPSHHGLSHVLALRERAVAGAVATDHLGLGHRQVSQRALDRPNGRHRLDRPARLRRVPECLLLVHAPTGVDVSPWFLVTRPPPAATRPV